MNRGERVFTNALALYLRMVVSVVPILLASRFILAALGVDDYGVYGVVAGIMGFMFFLNSAMASGSQRHLAYELGRGDRRQIGRVFSACLGIHLGIAALLVVLGETLGLWFLGHVLQIPEGRRQAAGWVYQFTILSVVANVLQAPFQAMLTAHEALVTISVLGIIQAMLTFSLALALTHLPGDHLTVYAFSVCAITLLVVVAQVLAALVRYPETRLGLRVAPDWCVVKEIISFSSWNLFGALAVVARFQGLAFLFNVFFGTAVNAAYNIAVQVAAATSQFTMALLQAVAPQVTKSEGAGDRERVLSLGLLTNKYAFLMDCAWLIPIYAELPTVLQMWLKNVPPYTTEFCRMALLTLALDRMSSGFMTTVWAIGKIALYQAVLGVTMISILPAGWVAFKIGCAPITILRMLLATFVVATLLRVWFVHRLTGMPYSRWFRAVILRLAGAMLPPTALAVGVCSVMPSGLWRLLVLVLVTLPALAAATFFLGMDAGEEAKWLTLAKSLASKWAMGSVITGALRRIEARCLRPDRKEDA